MEDRIKILFHNRDAAGVNYFRTQTPAMQLEREHSDKFFVEINSDLDFSAEGVSKTMEYLKSFHIIHYHRTMLQDLSQMVELVKQLKDAGVILIMDIDDYWRLDKSHPFYSTSLQNELPDQIVANLKMADYITTTTELFANEIERIVNKKNVTILYNSVDPTWMKQFRNNWKPDPNGLVRITYMAGSSHRKDVEQLEGVFNMLNSDQQTKGKFKTMVAGWDTEGHTTDVKFNKKFAAAMQKRKLWTRDMVKSVNKSNGDVDKIIGIPDDIKEEFRGNIFITNKRSIHSIESVYLDYEKILTDNHNTIHDEEYMKWLNKFERGKYYNEKTYGRRWTEKANIYAKVLDETDISIAPLADHQFNKMKSNLKQVECWSRKLPIVCTDIPPYNVDGENMKNCLLIPIKKNAFKYWFKALKKLILSEELRKELGEQLYEDFSEKYHLSTVTTIRANLYGEVVKNSLATI